jgi:hypothetical protein
MGTLTDKTEIGIELTEREKIYSPKRSKKYSFLTIAAMISFVLNLFIFL